MRRLSRRVRYTLPLILLAILCACTGDDRAVDVSFAASWKGQPLGCEEAVAGLDGRRIVDLRFYVSRPRMLRRGGGEQAIRLLADGIWQSENIVLIDLGGLCSGRGNAALHGKVAAGEYTGLAFDVGVPFAANHANPLTAVAPLNVGEMFWSWQLGHKFLRLDLAAGLAAAGWALHLGSTGCESDSVLRPPVARCRQPNRVVVELGSPAPERQRVQVELSALLDPAMLIDAPSCMGRFDAHPTCRAALGALGLDAASGGVCDPGVCGPQRVFRSQ